MYTNPQMFNWPVHWVQQSAGRNGWPLKSKWSSSRWHWQGAIPGKCPANSWDSNIPSRQRQTNVRKWIDRCSKFTRWNNPWKSKIGNQYETFVGAKCRPKTTIGQKNQKTFTSRKQRLNVRKSMQWIIKWIQYRVFGSEKGDEDANELEKERDKLQK